MKENNLLKGYPPYTRRQVAKVLENFTFSCFTALKYLLNLGRSQLMRHGFFKRRDHGKKVLQIESYGFIHK